MSRCSWSCEDGAGESGGLILPESAVGSRPRPGPGRPLRPASATPPGEADAKGRTKALRAGREKPAMNHGPEQPSGVSYQQLIERHKFETREEMRDVVSPDRPVLGRCPL
jgi:hypothetical protein